MMTLSLVDERTLEKIRLLRTMIGDQSIHVYNEECQLLFNQLNTLNVMSKQLQLETHDLLLSLQAKGYHI